MMKLFFLLLWEPGSFRINRIPHFRLAGLTSLSHLSYNMKIHIPRIMWGGGARPWSRTRCIWKLRSRVTSDKVLSPPSQHRQKQHWWEPSNTSPHGLPQWSFLSTEEHQCYKNQVRLTPWPPWWTFLSTLPSPLWLLSTLCPHCDVHSLWLRFSPLTCLYSCLHSPDWKLLQSKAFALLTLGISTLNLLIFVAWWFQRNFYQRINLLIDSLID
jgi:hypothetical protein